MKIFKYIIAAMAMITLAACQHDDNVLQEPVQDKIPDHLTLTLSIPDYSVANVGSRAENPTITSLCVISQKSDGTWLDTQEVTTGFKQVGADAGKNYEVTVPIHSQATRLQFVANMKVDDNITDLTKVLLTTPREDIYWGTAEVRDLISKTDASSKVYLLRNVAKVTVKSNDSNFIVKRFGVYGTGEKGCLAPADLNTNPTKPTTVAGLSYSYASGLGTTDRYVFETPVDNTPDSNKAPRTRAIIEGDYNGKTFYYVVAFRTESGSGHSEFPGAYSYTPLPIVRNFCYNIVIEEIESEGWTTLNDALKAPADNRVTYMIDATNQNVNSIATTSDYMLGVQDYVEAEATASSVMLTVVSTYPNTPRLTFDSNDTWILNDQISLPTPSEVKNVCENSVTSTAYVYNISLPLQANNSQSERIGYLTVKSGQLRRNVKVVQKARDYVRDTDRKVTLLIDNTTVTTDYFTWIQQGIIGAGADSFAQEGITRDNGLNFPAVPAYSAVYRIPVLSGDKEGYSISGSSKFHVQKSGNYYEVTMDTQSGPGIEEAVLSITNSSNVAIKYPIYRTGWMHELKNAYAEYQRIGGAKSGWYYYEVVKAGGKWTLDRNLGANGNKPYITTASSLRANADCIGAYFKVSIAKSSSIDNPITIIPKLGVGKFDLPKRSDLESMGISSRNIGLGEAILLASASTEAPSKVSEIYIPHGGYYEYMEPRFETHANLWTKTLVSGNQGFSVDSPDFGYWYQYFDCYTSKTGFSNMRFFDGGTGEAPSAESSYKYMPIRLVWN